MNRPNVADIFGVDVVGRNRAMTIGLRYRLPPDAIRLLNRGS